MRQTYFLLFLSLCLFNNQVHGQCLPDTENAFFQRFSIVNQMPDRIVSGRSLLFYGSSLSSKELERIQESFSSIGIDAILALEIEKLLAGHDVRNSLYQAIQKREISNLVFIRKNNQEYSCIMTNFNQRFSFVNSTQPAWQLSKGTLGELLVTISREVQNNFTRQNFLINDQPETEIRMNIIQGSRIESYSSDLRVDRLAVRTSDQNADNEALKEIMRDYPFKFEFVGDSISDAELRQKGFWYVLQSVHLPEKQARELLGYSSTKGFNPNPASVYKFYFKKLEYNNVYLGKEWDAAVTWQEAFQNMLSNLKKELSIK